MLLRPVKVLEREILHRDDCFGDHFSGPVEWGMARYGSRHWCVPITETGCSTVVSGEITTSKKKIRMCTYADTQYTRTEGGGRGWKLSGVTTATVASNKWPSSIWHIQCIACCVSIHSAIPHHNVRLYTPFLLFSIPTLLDDSLTFTGTVSFHLLCLYNPSFLFLYYFFMFSFRFLPIAFGFYSYVNTYVHIYVLYLFLKLFTSVI